MIHAEELFASIELSPIATIVTNPRIADNPIVAANAAFCTLTGYARDEVLGRNCRFLGGTDSEAAERAALRLAVAALRPVLVELTNYRRDGSPFRNAVMVAPMLDEAGGAAWFIGSQMDVSGRQAPRQAEAARRVDQLTPRQRQVLTHMVAGYRNKQIAGLLGIGEKTVKMHRKGLIANLGVATTADAIRIAVEAGVSRPAVS